MLFSNFYPFLIVICQTIVHHIRTETSQVEDFVSVAGNNKREANKRHLQPGTILLIIDWFCKIYFPAFAACFAVGYWIFGYLH